MKTIANRHTVRASMLAAIAMQVFCFVAFPSSVRAADNAHQASWPAVWDAGNNAFKRAVIGTLSIQDGQLVFKSVNGGGSWKMDLGDVRTVAVSAKYARESKAVVIESMTGVQRYVALLDDFRFGPPETIVRPVRLAVQERQTTALRASREDERERE